MALASSRSAVPVACVKPVSTEAVEATANYPGFGKDALLEGR